MKRVWIFVAFVVVALIALFVATRSADAVMDEPYQECNEYGPPNCASAGGTLMFCVDPCGQEYWRSLAGGVCQANSCWTFYWAPDGETQVIQYLNQCPYAVCNNEGGELEKPTPTDTWSAVKKLYRDE